VDAETAPARREIRGSDLLDWRFGHSSIIAGAVSRARVVA
jgi:hypothetical protein